MSSSDIWFFSDLHLFHKKLLLFKNFDGSPLRPEFVPNDPENPQELSRCLRDFHDTLLENTNKYITPSSKLYNLGDVAFLNNPDPIREYYSKINTKQHRLIYGNHDTPSVLLETRLFKKTGIWRVFKSENFVCSHVPIHKDSLKTEFNVHGHLHCPVVLNPDGTPDLHYINVCVEHTKYRPLHIDEILQMIKERKAKLDEQRHKAETTKEV